MLFILSIISIPDWDHCTDPFFPIWSEWPYCFHARNQSERSLLNSYYLQKRIGNCTLCLQFKSNNIITSPIQLILSAIDHNRTTSSFWLYIYFTVLLIITAHISNNSFLRFMLFPLLVNVLPQHALNSEIRLSMASMLQLLIDLIVINMHAYRLMYQIESG
jgi:hypothetical protein